MKIFHFLKILRSAQCWNQRVKHTSRPRATDDRAQRGADEDLQSFPCTRRKRRPILHASAALHGDMDAAVLRAYGWDDLADRAAPEFIEQEADEGKTPKTRLDWSAEFKDEVLVRLLRLMPNVPRQRRAAGRVCRLG